MKRTAIRDWLAVKLIRGMVRAAKWLYVTALKVIGVKP
jgi:hypothetical protein